MVQSTIRSRGSNESVKRRAPYALRACEACRRRKGKCDGRHPCRYCLGRAQNCRYNSAASEDWQPPSSSAVGEEEQGNNTQDVPRGNQSRPDGQWDPEAIGAMLCALQEQLDGLASRVPLPNMNNHSPPPSPPAAVGGGNDDGFLATLTNETESSPQTDMDGASKASRKSSSSHFFGPTSPDYSLNVAQMKLSGPPLQQQQYQLATIDEEDGSGDDDGVDADDAGPFGSVPIHSEKDQARLLQFRSFIGLQEAVRLVHIYHEVIGELHPILDIEELTSLARSCYGDSDSGVWDVFSRRPCAATEEQLLILNLTIAIALHADSTPTTSHAGALIRETFQDAVNAKLALPACSLKHVIIILLKGWYDYFYDNPRSAWRMCGIAGRMMMELGFHNGEVFKHLLDSEPRRIEAYTLMSTIVILDRQWSSATGLPTHFHESRFNPIPTACTPNPYLKAMLSFILISDRFSEPISQAAKGEGYNDEEAFELMTFQIEQWRKKAVGSHSLSQSENWATDPSSRPPTWTILLNLRAESVRSLLLRPFFFSDADPEATKTHLRSATTLVFNIVNVLYTLDNATAIYRKQHPYYQHILASACALAFLQIAYLEQNRSTLLATLSSDLTVSLSQSFEMAVALTTRYVKKSKAARRLSKRLSEMRLILVNLGILNRAKDTLQAETPNTRARRACQTPSMSQAAQIHSGFTPAFCNRVPAATTDGSFGLDLPPVGDVDLTSGWGDALRFQWQSGDISNMFSESMF